MKYEEALTQVIHENGTDFLSKPFLCYSTLSDLIGSSFLDSRKARNLYEISSRLDLVSVFLNNGLSKGRKIISEEYARGDFKMAPRDVVEAINPVSKLLLPYEYDEFERSRPKECRVKNEVASIKRANRETFISSEEGDNQAQAAQGTPRINKPKKPIAIPTKPNIIAHVCSASLEIIPSRIKSPYLCYRSNGSRTTKKSILAFSCDGSLEINANRPGKYSIHVPDILYKDVEIIGDRSDISLGNSKGNERIRAENLRCKTDGGNLSVNAKCDNLEMTASRGNATLKCSCSRTAISSVGGSTKGSLKIIDPEHAKISLAIVRGNASLKIDGINGVIRTSIFGSGNSVHRQMKVRGHMVPIQVSANHARVSIKGN